MADETIIDWRKRQGVQSHTREVATVEKLEKLPEDTIEQIRQLVQLVRQHGERITALENRPEPLIPSNSNDQVVIPKGVTDLVERVSNLEARVGESSVTHEHLDVLAKIIEDIGAAAMTTAEHQRKRLSALEAGVANLPSDLLLEVGRAQAELKNRHT